MWGTCTYVVREKVRKGTFLGIICRELLVPFLCVMKYMYVSSVQLGRVGYVVTCCILCCRLLPYGCMSTGNRMGFIEIVRKSETIANIQKDKSSRPKLGLWDSTVLYAWLKEKNPTEPQ